ncbi:MAG: M67 family metallopeptidase [Leptolyngbyaceae cyanobacterium SL_7_1]|nr:M67 family metallopeptidase [Leptolyngbyaceae cyanobacterium SL_7_1]
MTVHCSAVCLTALKSHAEGTYPHECCGVLLGRMLGAEQWLDDVREMVNQWDLSVEQEMQTVLPSSRRDHSKADRYWIDPRELLTIQREARDRSLQIIGIYHSHPDHPAVPSECDRVLAWMGYSYLIVSVQQGVAQDLLCWRLDENHQFQPEDVQVL